MQTKHLAVRYVRMARTIQHKCPDAELRILSAPYRIMFKWEQQLSDNSTMVWQRVINNWQAWLQLLEEMEAVLTTDKENDRDESRPDGIIHSDA